MVYELNIKQIDKLLSLIFKHPNEIKSPYIQGPPGIGKTSIVFDAAMKAGYDVILVHLGQLDPVDLRGIPYVDGITEILNPKTGLKEKIKLVRFSPPSFIPKKNKTVVFFDEITHAPPSVQNAAHQWILDKACGDYKFPEDTVVVAAGNGIEHGAQAYTMSAPLMSRFTLIKAIVDLDIWKSWAIPNGIHPDVISYLSYKGDKALFKYDRGQTKWAFPNPRGWEFVSKALNLTEDTDTTYKPVISAIIAGNIGEGNATEFVAFRELNEDLPDPMEILKGKEIKVPKKTDTLYLLCGAIVNKVQKEPTQAHITNVLKFSYKLKEEEFTVLLVRDLIKAVGTNKIVKNKEFKTKWIPRYSEIIEAVTKE